MGKSLGRYLTIAAAVISVMACACSEKEPGTGAGQDTEGDVVVKPVVNRNDVLHNPLNGWVMYAARTAEPSYWDKEIYLSELGQNVRIRDYASACYIRTSWASLNPRDGEYVWNDPSSQLYRLIKGAEERGIPIAFRVVVDGRDQGANTPDFVFDAGAEYWLENSRYPDRKTPLAMDETFRRYYEKFIEAFGKEFNDPKKTAFIDGYGLGKWGEGHNVCYEQGNAITDKTSEYKANTMEWITSLYARNFPDVPLVINYHRQIGHPVSSGKEAQPDSETVLAIAIKNGYCLRSDAIGMKNEEWGYGSWEKAFVSNWNYKLPVIMEGGWIVDQHDWSGEYGSKSEVRQGEYSASREAKVNMMDFRAGAETESWFVDAFSLVRSFVSEGGYRLYPDQISLPSEMESGADVRITHRWRNLGWGYFPNNIRQWNYKYKVAFALLDASGKTVKVFVDKECEPSDWKSGTPYSYDFDINADVPSGKYTWAVAIVDTTDGNVPAIQLAVKDEKTGDGWVKLMDVNVE